MMGLAGLFKTVGLRAYLVWFLLGLNGCFSSGWSAEQNHQSLELAEAFTHSEVSDVLRATETSMPEQMLESIEFKTGGHGQGYLSLTFAKPNPIVKISRHTGELRLQLPAVQLKQGLQTSWNLADSATPANKLEIESGPDEVLIRIWVADENYTYQSNLNAKVFKLELAPVHGVESKVRTNQPGSYQGNKLSLNFQDIDVRSVLQVLADFTGLNIIAADTVSGNLTLRLNDVPWDQALDLILKTKGLAKRQEGNVILVAPAAEITKIERDELDAQKVIDALIPLKTDTIQINYAKAVEICNVLLGFGNFGQSSQIATPVPAGSAVMQSGCGVSGGHQGVMLQEGATVKSEGTRIVSPRGVVIVDARTNVLIVKDTPMALEEIHKMVALLDVPVRQVFIEARIVVANTNFARNLGTKFGVKTNARDYQQADGLAELGYTVQAATAVATGGMSTLAGTLASGANYLLDLEIQAMQADGQGEQVANPRVMTSDRVKATISQGVQIPYTTQTANIINTNFKDAVLQLDVTPQITPGGSVIMELDITRDSQGKNVITGGQENVAIDRRGIKTKVQVEDGETLILGGVYESNLLDGNNLVPWLGELPGLGWLFRNQSSRHDKSELLVFVTPKIVDRSLLAGR